MLPLLLLLCAAASSLPLPRLTAGPAHGSALRRLWAERERGADAVTFSLSPPPGVTGPDHVVQLSAPEADRARPHAAGLGAGTDVGHATPVAAYSHWVDPSRLPEDYDARQAYPACSTMRAIQNQGACAGC